MVLKQRFAEGRTNYKDIGNDWMYIQNAAQHEFNNILKDHFVNEANGKDCIGFICWGKEIEPIYKDFPQWIYSSDGQLFMTLA